MSVEPERQSWWKSCTTPLNASAVRLPYIVMALCNYCQKNRRPPRIPQKRAVAAVDGTIYETGYADGAPIASADGRVDFAATAARYMRQCC